MNTKHGKPIFFEHISISTEESFCGLILTIFSDGCTYITNIDKILNKTSINADSVTSTSTFAPSFNSSLMNGESMNIEAFIEEIDIYNDEKYSEMIFQFNFCENNSPKKIEFFSDFWAIVFDGIIDEQSGMETINVYKFSLETFDFSLIFVDYSFSYVDWTTSSSSRHLICIPTINPETILFVPILEEISEKKVDMITPLISLGPFSNEDENLLLRRVVVNRGLNFTDHSANTFHFAAWGDSDVLVFIKFQITLDSAEIKTKTKEQLNFDVSVNHWIGCLTSVINQNEQLKVNFIHELSFNPYSSHYTSANILYSTEKGISCGHLLFPFHTLGLKLWFVAYQPYKNLSRNSHFCWSKTPLNYNRIAPCYLICEDNDYIVQFVDHEFSFVLTKVPSLGHNKWNYFIQIGKYHRFGIDKDGLFTHLFISPEKEHEGNYYDIDTHKKLQLADKAFENETSFVSIFINHLHDSRQLNTVNTTDVDDKGSKNLKKLKHQNDKNINKKIQKIKTQKESKNIENIETSESSENIETSETSEFNTPFAIFNYRFLNRCDYCGKLLTRPQRCICCKKAIYCDAECQKLHWPTHNCKKKD
eukprot:TRINITY_DN2312_c0_g1_i1.p1 TRINITY_DN2312_c0_g1~~TRINITY_DN2312_c0_g1_i1.p1  ORF type:complete len:590 (+),score=139.38 TRINITY_DN2312_c0_g1_i1:35-1804(+)